MSVLSVPLHNVLSCKSRHLLKKWVKLSRRSRLSIVLAAVIAAWMAKERRRLSVTFARMRAEGAYLLTVLQVILRSIGLSMFSPPVRLPEGLADVQPYKVVFVPGLMSMGRNYPVECLGSNALVAELSPYASSHDRAVELFYTLKGGQVDYGEEHSKHFGHERFGRMFIARLPEWSKNRPVVMVAHSHGGNTVRMLQHLLQIGFFPGYVTSAAWIKAVVCLAAPLNGCPVLHGLGMPLRSQSQGELTSTAIDVKAGQGVGGIFSIVRFGQTVGYVLHWALGDFAWSRAVYDWGLDHWKLTRRSGGWRQLWHLVRGSHHILNTDDTAGYDLTVDGAARLNALFGEPHASTYYFSLPCVWTREAPGASFGSRPVPCATPTFTLVPFGALIASCTPDGKPTERIGEWSAEEWQENDSMVPVRSQLQPREGLEPAAAAARPLEQETALLDAWAEGDPLPAPGVWHVFSPSHVDHRAAMTFAPPLDVKLRQVMQILGASAAPAMADDWLLLDGASTRGRSVRGV